MREQKTEKLNIQNYTIGHQCFSNYESCDISCAGKYNYLKVMFELQQLFDAAVSDDLTGFIKQVKQN